MAIPVITSATPAYDRAMATAGLEMNCVTIEDWQRVLRRTIDNQAVRTEAGQRGFRAANEFYSRQETLQHWDRLFASLGL